MKIESRIFGLGVFFFVPVAFIYGYLTELDANGSARWPSCWSVASPA